MGKEAYGREKSENKNGIDSKICINIQFLILLFVQKETKNVRIDFDAYEIQFRGDVSGLGFQTKE